MTSVNTNSGYAANMRSEAFKLIDGVGREGFRVFGGHGAVKTL
jgi:hypothetical protein